MPFAPRRAVAALMLAGLVAACGGKPEATRASYTPGGPGQINGLIQQYARQYDVPVELVHRVVKRESGYNPAARNGPYYGLMQINPNTAQTMGFRGNPNQLLDAETNLKYAVKYLRGAWLVADGSHDRAVSWYSKGYYYEAKKRGLLEDAGLR